MHGVNNLLLSHCSPDVSTYWGICRRHDIFAPNMLFSGMWTSECRTEDVGRKDVRLSRRGKSRS